MKLYVIADGPPSLAVRMLLAELQIPYDLHILDYAAGEHMTEEFGKVCTRYDTTFTQGNRLEVTAT